MKKNWSQTGQNIRTLRKSQNLTVKELAGKIDVCSKTITNIENGTTEAKIPILHKISEALDCSFEDLINLHEHKLTLNIQRKSVDKNTMLAPDIRDIEQRMLSFQEEVRQKLTQILERLG